MEKLFPTSDDSVTSVSGEDVTLVSPTDLEEADTRVHENDMSNQELSSVMIQTVDTDVLFLALSLFKKLKLEKLWMDFGSGKQRCFLTIHDMLLDPAMLALDFPWH